MDEQRNRSTLSVRRGELSGQVALVTGGGRGIGRATAVALATAGARVAIVSRSQGDLERTQALMEQVGGQGLSFVTDIRDQVAVENLVRQTETQWGAIDLLVNNAGSSVGLGRVVDVEPRKWWSDIETCLYGSMLMTHTILPGMIARGHGRIINVASRVGIVPFPFVSSYAVAKTALIRFTESLDLEVRGQGVMTFAIHPGEVPTGITPQKSPDSLLPDAFIDNYVQQLHDTPELGAQLITYLATGKADALTGCFINAHDDVLALIARAESIQRAGLQRLRLSM